MTTQPLRHTVSDPWQDKGGRFWLVVGLVFLACSAFAAYDSPGFYARYMKLCMDQPTRADCRPLNLVKEERRPDPGVTLDYGKGNWALAVGARQSEAEANALASQLRSFGIEPRLIKTPGRGKKTWYQMQVGRFPTRKSANEAGTQLKNKGLIQDFIPAQYQALR